MRNDVLNKGAELEAAKAKIRDLQEVVDKKDCIIVELKRLMHRIKVSLATTRYILTGFLSFLLH